MSSRILRPEVAVTLVLIALAIQMLLYTGRFAVNMLFWDQWSFYIPFLGGMNWVDAFRLQHGPHRQGLGSALIYLVAQLSAWDGRADAFLSAAVLIVATALALFLKVRVAGRLSLWDLWIPILFLSLNQWELLTVVPNVAVSILPLALLMLYGLILTLDRAPAQLIGISVLNALLLYTGYTIFAAFLTPALFVYRSVRPERAGFDRRTRWMWLLGLAFSALALASYFVDWRFVTAVDCAIFPHPRPLEYAVFAGLQVAQGFGLAPMANELNPANGAAMFAGLAVIFCAVAIAARSVLARAGAVSAFLIGVSLLYVAGTAATRVCLGATQQPLSSRYVTLVLPLLLGVYLWAARVGGARLVAAGVTAAVLIGLSFVAPFHRDPWTGTPQFFHDAKETWRACYLDSLDPFACDATSTYPMYPDTRVIAGPLRELERRGLNLFKNAPRDIQIVEPADRSALAASRVELMGVIDPPGFERYQVQWGAGEFPTEWQWLSGPHLSPVRRGPITTWETANLPSGVYTVRVTVFTQGGRQRVALVRLVRP